MKERIVLLIKYYIYWILFFAIQKPLFMLCQYRIYEGVSFTDCLRVLWHALPLDLSVAAYVTAVFGILLVISYYVSETIIVFVSDLFTALALTVGLLVFIGDTGVFPSWGFHLDRTLFFYLSSPTEVLACAEWWVWFVSIAVFIVTFMLCYIVYRRYIWQSSRMFTSAGFSFDISRLSVWHRIGGSFLQLLLVALLFLPIRGSISVSTMNTGRVYFSEDHRLNLAAVNPVFNIVESFSCPLFDKQRYTYMPDDEAKHLILETLDNCSSSIDLSDTLLNSSRPDIVFLIVESLSANVVEACGGEPDATSNLNRYIRHGVVFTNVYASSFRTDRGVVACLSAFPGQPTSSLMIVPSKCASLPYWTRDLQSQGYALKFWYGGDEDFTSMRSYLLYAGFTERVCDKSFTVADRLSKWGVPDHILMDVAAKEIAGRPMSVTAPACDVVLTLSSHEPFTVAFNRYADPYVNAIAYTDSCIGAFLDTLRLSPHWDNTLVIITADHGFMYPHDVANADPRHFRIPVVFCGGAVRQTATIDKVCSQIDIVPTMLAQLGLPYEHYHFAKNVLNEESPAVAFYTYNDGVGYVTASGTTVFDASAAKTIIHTDTIEVNECAKRAKAFVQQVYDVIEQL